MIPNHVFVQFKSNTNTPNVYSKTVKLYPIYFGEVVDPEKTPIFIPKCEYPVGAGAPIPAVLTTTTAIGFSSSITMTVDTFNMINPPMSMHIKCVRWKGTNWDPDPAFTILIPFLLEIQDIPDCSVGWFTWWN